MIFRPLNCFLDGGLLALPAEWSGLPVLPQGSVKVSQLRTHKVRNSSPKSSASLLARRGQLLA
jgi:hypothetical protein